MENLSENQRVCQRVPADLEQLRLKDLYLRISLHEVLLDLKVSDDDFDRMFPEPLQLPDD